MDHRDGERRVRFVRILALSPAAADRKHRAGAYEQDPGERMTPPHSEATISAGSPAGRTRRRIAPPAACDGGCGDGWSAPVGRGVTSR